MRRRGFLLLGGSAAALLAGAGYAQRAARPARAPAPQPPPLSTDVEPLAARLPKLGRIVSAHWQERSPAVANGRITVPGPTDSFLHAVLQLSPGAVGALTAAVPLVPAAAPAPPPVPSDTAGFVGLSAELAAFLPAGAHWTRSPLLDSTLVRADAAGLLFDLSSDTVFLDAENLAAPDAVDVHP
ncbi:hypothetical protein GCM10009665_27470 [Kitasatospora nipponensis]|uniref:Secreted protein n=1 Tax=Kitasatospora nipponensis TaxID=258049 RepID=A0ABN1W888_9ACTN